MNIRWLFPTKPEKQSPSSQVAQGPRLRLLKHRIGAENSSCVTMDAIESFPVVIGRGRMADVELEDRYISSVHCRIDFLDGMFILQDLESRNGTFVNNRQTSLTRLEPGDVIEIGLTSLTVIDTIPPSAGS